MLLKALLLSLIVFSTPNSFASEQVKQCQETCVDFEEPGYALKKCLSKCLRYLENSEKSYCNSYEEGCDRDGDSDDGPWFNG